MMEITIIIISIALLLILQLRGGTLHNHLVLEAGKIFQKAGFTTIPEYPQHLPNGQLDFIDLLAQQGPYLICVEVETSARNVLVNVAKADQLKLPLIILVPNRKIQKAVRKRLESSSQTTEKLSIKILLLGQLQKEVTNCFPLFFTVNKQRENRKTNKGGK